MANHLAIGERLRKAKSPEAIYATVTDWVKNWEEDQRRTLEELRFCLYHKNYDKAKGILVQLEAITDKRFGAMPRVINKIFNKE
jgi:hypothetical protein